MSALWSWWSDDEKFQPFDADLNATLESAFQRDGDRAKVTLHTERGDYIVKKDKKKGWMQHRAGNSRLWRAVERGK